MPGSRLNVHLYRDSFNTPWGFRLQGGKDLSQPLTVQRVFSNSPAEGELQRGDVILSINGRDAAELTHKQAQDYIKHGGGQVQLIVNRPPPGTHVAPLSPPIVTQRPRAPSLQSPLSYNPPPRPINISMAQNNYDPSFVPSMGDHYYSQQSESKPPNQPLHVQAIPPAQNSPNYQRQRSSHSQPPSTPTPTTPIPPWAAQQFAPKKVSKLSKLGGGGLNFGTEYSTLPRRSSGAHYGVRAPTHSQSGELYNGPEETVPDRLASGPVPRVCSRRNLGGGGPSFGTTFGSGAATLPRPSTGRRLSQPVSMPSAGGYGHKPTKVNLTRLGGGGPEFGSDFSHKGYGQTPSYGQTPAQRVHTSLDTITLSPRSQEVSQSSPFYQAYDSQPAAPVYQPSYAPPPAPQQVYTPTGLLLEQQRLQEQQQPQDEGEAIVPVWERRKQFQKGPGQSTTVRTPANRPPPKVPKPQPGPSSFSSFGTDYSKSPPQRQSSATWRPTPQFKPTPAPVSAPAATFSPAAVSYSPKPGPPPPPKPSPPAPSQGITHASPPAWQPNREIEVETGTPAWRSTLKATGVKPWEMDTTNYSLEQQPVRSVPYSPAPPKSPIQSAPFSPTQTGAIEVGGSDNGPKVVHLQYNSPMHLYSNQNVEETLHGQTMALAGQTQKQPPPPTTNESGERDWSQSAVLRFISQEDKRKPSKPAPPAVAPKPQAQVYSPVSPPQANQGYFEEIGASDF